MPKATEVADFRNDCLQLIEQLARNHQPVTITKQGKPVAVLAPVGEADKPRSIIGAVRGSVLRFDDPFTPAADPSEWNAVRDTDLIPMS